MDGYAHHAPPLRFSRDGLISPDQAARVHEVAKRVLREIGMEVRHTGVLEQLRDAGFRISDGRVFFEPGTVDEYVDEMRRTVSSWSAPPSVSDDGRLTLSVSAYSLHVHDVGTGRVLPYTTGRLVEMCKLMDSLAEDGVCGAPPGIPTDEPPDLQPIAQYRIAALYARQGASPVDPTSARTVDYLLDMAEVMGQPIHHLPVYIPTPLRLGGESLEVVLSCVNRLSHISISSMPATGATAPLHPFGALALAAAELMGGAVAVRALTGKPTTFAVGIFPFDLRAGAMVFGSPENMLFQMLCADFNHFYGWIQDPMPDNIHVMATLPDTQSASEKAAIMALGAFMGARHFSCAGTLSLDDIFSPEQLLVDCEIRDWVQRAIRGVWMGEEVVDDWLSEIRAGLQRGFTMLDSTLDYYKVHTWYPQRFRRGAVGPWLSDGQPPFSDRLRDEVRRRIAAHDFELDADRRREIEKIYRRARAAIE